ncbi:hypothetical protein IEE92_02375 [Kocuria sp. cx-116]|uniref:hypothetical protein n=1 Tax=Kocuria sp. cx-116 TaxID=2771378 RepID=UPI001682EDE6|nr:hypothetical protein [Kocuria sp. cx-116]MBD2761407.1 hypothetical protein [Kocuria sp. cx-116]
MTDYALNDRGSLDVVTENFYDTEIMRVFGGLSLGRSQTWTGLAALVPEPDHPFDPRTISVRIGENKVAHLPAQDAHRYWDPIARVVASGYIPVVPLKLDARLERNDGLAEVDANAVISIAPPDMLFPINTAPIQAAVLPQGSSIKVLDEQDFAEYLHSIVPAGGEGRVIVTLETNKVRNSHGMTVDTVDVLYERKQVGRLSTQMSQQFIPIIKHAFDHNLLTAAWGTIRGSAFEVSMTLQAARATEVPEQWYEELPNDVPELVAEAETYEVPPAYIPVETDRGRNSKKWRKGYTAAHPNGPADAAASRPAAGSSRVDADPLAMGDQPPVEGRRNAPKGAKTTVLALALLTVLLVVGAVILIPFEPLATTLFIIVAVATGFMAFYLNRTL